MAALLPSWSARLPKEAAPNQDSRPGFEIVDKKNSRRKIGKRHEAVDESTKVEALWKNKKRDFGTFDVGDEEVIDWVPDSMKLHW